MKLFAPLTSKIRLIGLFFAKPGILFYTLPWLMFLIVMGTITQKDLGLYDATQKYFSSLILWLGPVPTPGGITTIGVIFISLTVKFLFYSQWHKKRIGIILTHLGILLLILGGIITAISNKEGFMIIPEGRNINAIAHYYDRVLEISDTKDTKNIFNFDALEKGQVIKASNLKIKILEKCDNCGARAPTGIYKNLQGLAANMELYPRPSEKQKEANFSGLVLDVTTHNSDDAQAGTYIVMEDIPNNPIFNLSDNKIEISLKRATRTLPFSIFLKDFRKINYAQTDKAKEFESDIVIHDNGITWPHTISMNKPLRYKGYTFYQSSFEQLPDVEVTVLNVVQNSGRAFPYISTLIIFLGLLIHLIIHLERRKNKQGLKNA